MCYIYCINFFIFLVKIKFFINIKRPMKSTSIFNEIKGHKYAKKMKILTNKK